MTAERGAAIFRGPDPGAQQRSGSSYFLQGRGGGDAVPAGRVFWRRKSTRLTMREQPGRSGISIQHPPARTPLPQRHPRIFTTGIWWGDLPRWTDPGMSLPGQRTSHSIWLLPRPKSGASRDCSPNLNDRVWIIMLNNNAGGRRSSLPSVLRKRPSTPTTPHLYPGLQREE